MSGCGIPLDPRLDAEVVELNKQATGILPNFCKGAREEIDDQGFPVDYSKRWLVYLAAEIHGNSDAGFIALSHNCGRQARIFERQVYECMKKAEYYVAYPDEARLEYLVWPFRDRGFCDELQMDKKSPHYEKIEACIAMVSTKFPDVPIYYEKHKKDGCPVKRMVERLDKAPLEFDSDAEKLIDGDVLRISPTLEYALYYRRLSQALHAGTLGMWDVLAYSQGGEIGVRFDSRLENPNKSLHSMTRCLVNFLDLFEQAFVLGRHREVEEFDKEHIRIMERLCQS